MCVALVQRQYIRHMDMPAHDNIGAGRGPTAHGGVPAMQKISSIRFSNHRDRLMHDDDPQLLRSRSLKQADYALDLSR